MKVYSIKKTLAILLAVLMLVSVLPLTVFAEVRTDGKVLRTDICKIGNQGYETFQDAVNAVPADGQEVVITLLKSVYAEGTTVIPKGKNITIELNGKTYAFENDVPGVALFENYGTLTFQDQTDTERNGTGRGQVMSYPLMPDMSPCPGYSQNTVTNKGTVNVKSGYIMSQGDGQGAFVIDCQAIHASNDVALNVSGGKLESVTSSAAVRMYTHKDNACDVSITGGVVTSLWVQDGNGGADGKGSLTIKKPATFLNNLSVTGYAGGVLKNFKLDIDSVEFGSDVTYNFDPNEPGNSITIKGLKARSFSMNTPAKLLSDGYFMNPVDAACIVDGYVCLPNPDKNVKDANGNVYNYKICNEEDIPEDIEYGARIIHANGTCTEDDYYFTMGYAISAVQDGDTVQLLKDGYGDVTCAYNKTLKFDLNGYTLYGGFINDGGQLTIDDTSKAKTGTVERKNYCIYIDGYSFNAGEYTEADTVINGGNFKVLNNDYGVIMTDGYCYYTTSTVNGGTFTGAPFFSCDPGGSSNKRIGAWTVNGGHIEGDFKWPSWYDGYAHTENGYICEINGGEFDGTVTLRQYYSGEKCIITNGLFHDIIDSYEYAHDAITITGGQFDDDVAITNWKKTDGQFDSGIYGGVFAFDEYSDGSKTYWEYYGIPTGYGKGMNTDEDTMSAYPFTVRPLQIDLKEVSVNEEGQVTGLDVKSHDGTTMQADDSQAAVNEIKDTQKNTAVGNFTDTNLDKAFAGEKKDGDYALSIALEAVKKQIASDPYLSEHYEAYINENHAISIREKKDDVEAKTYTDEDIDVKVKVDAKAATVEVKTSEEGEGTKTAIINSETFDVKPIAKTSVTKTEEITEYDDEQGKEITRTVTSSIQVEAPLDNEDIKEPIAFRLPISKNTPAGYTAVYHCSEEDYEMEGNLLKDYLGMLPILTDPDTGDKYIQLEAMSFSYYTIQNMNGITTSNVVAIKDASGNYRGFDTLAEGIADYGKDVGKVFLESDFSGTAYEDAAAAQAAVTVYQDTEGDGKFYLTENFTGAGYDTAAEARATVPVFQKPADESLIILKDMLTVSDDFLSKTITLDLNGLTFEGEVTNAKNVTVINSDDLHQETLAAVGQYGVNVSAFVADGYGTKKTDIADDTVILADAGVYKVVVVTSTKTDRDPATDDVDVYAFDNVDVEVRVYGPRFVAADVTLTYDDDNFEINADYDTPNGWSERANTFHYYNAKPKNSENNYYVPDQIDENGNAYYSLGKWVFTVLDRDASEFDTDDAGKPIMHVPFEVKAEEGEGDYIRNTYVSGAWKDGWSSDVDNKLDPDTQLTNDYANIRLIDMAVKVNTAEGLVFKNQDQALFVASKPYEATAAGKPIKLAEGKEITLETCVLTSEEVANGIVPTDDDYFEGLPEALNADTYTVYYKVSAPGYVTVTGSTTVTIAPKDIDVKWMVDSEIGEDFTIAYSESGGKAYDAPNAWFQDVDGNNIDKDGVVEGYYLNADYSGNKYDTMNAAKAAVTAYQFTEGEGADNKWYLEEDYSGTPYDKEELAKAAAVYTKHGSKTIYTEIKLIQVDEFAITGAAQTSTALQKVGKYTYQVNIVENGRYSSNYNILSGETQKVIIEGGRFSGYSLINASEGEAVYYDEQSHVPAKLSVNLDDENTHPGQGEPAPTVTYSWMKAGDPAGWHEGLSTIPSFTDMGTYILKANLTADSYYNYETEPVYFTVKPVDYKAETFEWVAGWSVVLVYTNEDIPGFTYDGTLMFNMDGLDYKFGADLAADGSRGDESFNHVFGIVVFGAANTTLVCSSNDTAKSINNIDDGEYDSRYDVNHNNGVLIDDYVAVQGTYNVEKTYFDAVNQVVISDSIMQTVLKADVNGDKIVDTYDVALIKANSDNN